MLQRLESRTLCAVALVAEIRLGSLLWLVVERLEVFTPAQCTRCGQTHRRTSQPGPRLLVSFCFAVRFGSFFSQIYLVFLSSGLSLCSTRRTSSTASDSSFMTGKRSNVIFANLSEVQLGSLSGHVVLDHPPDTGVVFPGDLAHLGNWHRRGEGDEQRLEQQGESRPRTSPRDVDLVYPVLMATHPRQTSMHVGLV